MHFKIEYSVYSADRQMEVLKSSGLVHFMKNCTLS